MGNDKLQEKYQAFIHNSSEGIWLFELDKPIPVTLNPETQVKRIFKYGYLAEANDAMARMYGFESASQLVGARLPDLMLQDDPQNIAYLRAFIESGYHLSGTESREKDRHGQERIFRNSLVGVVEDGKVLRAWGMQQDITEQYRMNRELQESQERLELALKVSKIGWWERDVATSHLTWSDEMKRLFGQPPDAEVDSEMYWDLVHPDDRPQVRRTARQLLKVGDEYQIEYRIRWRDGTEHWILDMGRGIVSDGKVIRTIGTCVSLDDTKRKAELEVINRKLKEQQEQLLELNNAKDEFIALASHQLRTPATAVKQYSNMLIDGYFGELSTDQQRAVQTALASNERQLDIINDLLRVAQLDAGKVILQKRRTDLVSLLQQVVGEQAGRFEAKGQTVTVRHSRPHVWAEVDPGRMCMVFENLVDNAHKYTLSGKAVTVTISQRANRAYIRIADQGVGIHEADLPKLFQKFSRLEHELTGDISGTGLGLYWAYKIVALHDGVIEVTSAVNKGTTFTVSVPVA
jgi:PAS domain S-box-containing protein